MCLDFGGHHSGSSSFDMTFGFYYKMWAIPTGTRSTKKKKNSGKESQSWSRVPKTGSDPPIGSDRDSGRDTDAQSCPSAGSSLSSA